MGRHTNKLEQLLLEDPNALKEFTDLANQYKTTSALCDHLRSRGFRNEKFNFRYQVLARIVRNLGISKTKGSRRGRPINPLLKDLIEDTCRQREFIKMINTLGRKGLYLYLKEKEFFGKKYYVSGHTILNIVRRLGYKGRKGRPSKVRPTTFTKV
jgi:hypothetical protein